jgi:hypothetical protein
MENHTADERLMRLERALLRRGGRAVACAPDSDLDLAGLRDEMGRLGFRLVVCEPRGYAWLAQFRRAADPDGRAVHGSAEAFSEANAVVEAAIAALEAENRAGPRDGPGGPVAPAPLERWRRARPWKRTSRVPPAVGG